VRIAGNHIHHQVFGILIIIGTGIVLVSATPHRAALDVAAAAITFVGALRPWRALTRTAAPCAELIVRYD
jgi:hypothetical protein